MRMTMHTSNWGSFQNNGTYQTKRKRREERARKRVLAAPKTEKAAAKFDFYKTQAWREIRFKALKAGNGCCALCGRSQRAHKIVLHVDHIKPLSKFPKLALTLSNLQVLCEDCNLGKSNRDTTDWRDLAATDTTQPVAARPDIGEREGEGI